MYPGVTAKYRTSG